MTSIPNQFICPLSMDIMEDPVIDHEGNTYDRVSIEHWLLHHNTSPITRNLLLASNLVPNRALKDQITEFKESNAMVSGATLTHTITSAPTPIYLVSNSFQTPDKVVISLNTNLIAQRLPVHIICVVDVSGSMNTEVTIKTSEGIIERNGLSRLDLVKHALNTIVYSLNENDYISIIKFSATASVVIKNTKLNQVGKAITFQHIKNLHPDGSTNIWDGLKNGLELISSCSLNV